MTESQMKKVKSNPGKRGGWTIDFETLRSVQKKAETLEYVELEHIEAIMLAMIHFGYAEMSDDVHDAAPTRGRG